MDKRIEKLASEQMDEVQAQHPNLELQRDPDGQLYVRGTVGFSIEHDSRTVTDFYRLELKIPNDYPKSPPLIFETEGRIPKQFGHFMRAGNFCLEAPVEVRRRFTQHRNLLRFIDEQVIPYLFAYSYKREFGVLPFQDRPHGPAGLLQYYTEFFQTSGETTKTLQEFFERSGVPAMKLLKCLADDWAPPRIACPCGSGLKLRDCHGPSLEELRPHQSPECFETELGQIAEDARASGIRLPEGAVLPLGMLRLKRLHSGKRRDRKRPPK